MKILYALASIILVFFAGLIQSILVIPIFDGLYIDFILMVVVFSIRNHARAYLLLGAGIAALYLDTISLLPLGFSMLWYSIVVFSMISFRNSAYRYSLMNIFVVYVLGVFSKLVYVLIIASILRMFSYRMPLFTLEDLASLGISIACMILICTCRYLLQVFKGTRDEL